jgi:excinuclease ABC subunit C
MVILEEKLQNLPVSPGVYLYKDTAGRIIYVGKAKNLRNRVRSYFQTGREHDHKTTRLVSHIVDLEFIITDNEVEALVLESNLIKKHKPRFNILLKDDKQYPHLKLTINEPFPRVMITRRVQRDGALYFGPFLPASLARRTIDLINRTFQLRTCDIEIDGRLPRPCLEYHIKRCLGPCVKGLCTLEEYQESVRDVKMFLEGKNKELADELESRMMSASEKMQYELAAKYRDLRKVVIAIGEQQKMATSPDKDVDIFGYYREGPRLALQLFTMREGKIIGRREFFWEDLSEENFDPSAFLSEVLTQYYSTDYVPLEIHVPVDFEDREILEIALTDRRGRRVRILYPQRGEKRDLIDLVEKNAQLAFEQRFRILKPDMEHVLEELQETLELPRFPARIESFDVSNISGAENVAGMVVFENGKINNAERRHFRIKTVEGANDFASMKEAVYRRYRRQLEETKPLPDLILIDGGRGQLRSAAEAMSELELEAVPMVGVVKPPNKHNSISHLLVKGREHNPVYLDSHSAVFRFIQLVRDETHKAAVNYHRKRREIRDFTSELTAIPGVGEKRKSRLLRHFGSIVRVSNATVAELSPFVGQKTAEDIVAHFARGRELASIPNQENNNIEPSTVNTSLVDPNGEAEDLQPVRAANQSGSLRVTRNRTRKRVPLPANSHSITRHERLADANNELTVDPRKETKT